MRFGPVPVGEAEGALLAHSIGLPDGKLKKGRVLSAADLDRLRAAGETEVVVARLEDGDVPEDAAAARIAAAIVPGAEALGMTVSAPFTGRVNLFARETGVVELDEDRIARLNAIDPAVTLATLAPFARVEARQMVATVKIIPYAAPEAAVAAAERLAGGAPMIRVHPVAVRSAGLLLTRVPGMAEKVLEKGAEAVRARLAALGIRVAEERTVPHTEAGIARALAGMQGELLLILTGSATSDAHDVGPGGLVAAGGRVARYGMPVDPGNLLFLGHIDGRSVIGLPGCAKSPKLNGADWVLERLACGIEVGPEAIGRMGVGGLLKEIPSRPSPRAGRPEGPRRPSVSAVVLAAGSGTRMRGRDKLLEPVGGRPLLARIAGEAAASGAEETIVVLREGDAARRAALEGIGVRIVENPRAAEGMGTSIAAGLRATAGGADAAMLILADMPEISRADMGRLIAAFDPEEGREIVRGTAADGRPGHPVLFGRRFFEPLRALEGDCGARRVLSEHRDFVTDVALTREAALTDLDTPEAWEAWRAAMADG